MLSDDMKDLNNYEQMIMNEKNSNNNEKSQENKISNQFKNKPIESKDLIFKENLCKMKNEKACQQLKIL